MFSHHHLINISKMKFIFCPKHLENKPSVLFFKNSIKGSTISKSPENASYSTSSLSLNFLILDFSLEISSIHLSFSISTSATISPQLNQTWTVTLQDYCDNRFCPNLSFILSNTAQFVFLQHSFHYNSSLLKNIP